MLPIPNWPDYGVDTQGNVYSLRSGRIMRPTTHKSGYLRVTLCKNRYTRTYLVHRLVALTYIPNPYNLAEVDHIDGNRANNDVRNLQWLSSVDNKIKALAKPCIIFSPKCERYDVPNLVTFCREFDLCYTAMAQVITGKRPHYKCWTGKRIQP